MDALQTIARIVGFIFLFYFLPTTLRTEKYMFGIDIYSLSFPVSPCRKLSADRRGKGVRTAKSAKLWQ